MPILTPIDAPNGVPVSYHKIAKLEEEFDLDIAVLWIESHPHEAAALEKKPHAFVWRLQMPLVAIELLRGDEPRSFQVERLLITDAGSPFLGGQITVDQTDTLEGAQARAWVRIKGAREAALTGNFTYDSSTIQINKVDVNGAVSGALICKEMGLPYSTTWTLADNTTRTFDGPGVLAMGLALLQYVNEVHDRARGYRAAIAAAQTIEEATNVVWMLS
jgi:hypothetical protein